MTALRALPNARANGGGSIARASALALVWALTLAVPCLAQAQVAPDYTAPPVAALPSTGPVAGARYVIDPTHTFVNYEIGHYGTTTNRGRFSTSDGAVTVDATGRGGRVEVTMDMTSINTGVDLLNRHLQSRDFFNVAAFPTARFEADGLRFSGDRVVEVAGTLTVLGRTHPLALKATRFNCYLNPVHRRQVCGGDFEAVVERSRWGLTWGLDFGFEDRVRLLVQIEAIRVER